MQHSFDVDIAKEYGITEAILLNNMWFWVEKNKANEINFYDGNYWTYNSTKAFSKLFPYFSRRKIKTALDKLKEKGIIETGNYNTNAYDRTLWYAFTKMGQCIMQKCKMEEPIMSNGLVENVTPIPDSKPNVSTDNKPYISKSFKKLILEKNFSDKLCETIETWLKYKAEKKSTYQETGFTMLLTKIEKSTKEFGEQTVINAIEDAIAKNYQGFFPKSDKNSSNTNISAPDYSCGDDETL